MKNLKVSSPWTHYYHKLEALFADDPDVKMDYDPDARAIDVYVNGARKSEALMQLLPAKREFGNVTLKVTVIPANDSEVSDVDLLRDAFEGNPALSHIETIMDLAHNPVNYAMFQNKVVQYWNDNFGDPNGMCSTLYQDIATDVFRNIDGVFFTTDTPS